MTRAASWSRAAGRLVLAAALAVPALAAVSGTGASASGKPAAAASAARGTLRGWGTGDDGQLGNGHRKNAQLTPVRVRLGPGVRVTSVRAGCDHALALTPKGHVLAWGLNAEGQLGNGSRTSADRPVRVRLPTGTKIKAIRAGCDHSLALTTKGHVLAWGYNHLGELGNGSKRRHTRPVRVKIPRGTKIKAISAGCDHNLALTTKDRVLAWGFNGNGQLGIGSRSLKTRPVRVRFPGNARIRIIAAGCDHSLAFSTRRQLFSWGWNGDGQLGDGTTTERNRPVPVSLDGSAKVGPLTRGAAPHRTARPKVVSLFGGIHHSLALLSDGDLLSWGGNEAGQLGDGTGENSDVPVQVALPGGTKVTAISAGCFNGLALTSTDQLWAWGDNAGGELGNGTTTNSNVPVRVALAAGLRVTGSGGGPCAQTFFAIVHGS
jgi:alpha-tubulin suppressor-like RCC1 family protein